MYMVTFLVDVKRGRIIQLVRESLGRNQKTVCCLMSGKCLLEFALLKQVSFQTSQHGIHFSKALSDLMIGSLF